MFLLHPELSDATNGCILSSSNSIAPSMPLSNLQSAQPTDKCRFTDLSQTIRFSIDLSIPFASGIYTSWNAIYLPFSNLDVNATITITASNVSIAASISSPFYTPSTFSAWPSPNLKPWFPRIHSRHVVAGNGVRTERYITVTISNPGNVAGYIDLGRLYVALGAHLPTPERYPMPLPYPSETERVVKAEGGADYARQGGIDENLSSYPVIFSGKGRGVGVPDPSSTQRALLAAQDFYGKIVRVQRLRGVSRDILVDFDPSDTVNAMDKILYGRLTGVQQPQLIAPSTYQVVLNVKGMR